MTSEQDKQFQEETKANKAHDTANKAHDTFVKKAMSRIYVAREFFESYLPENIREIVDLETLKKRDTNFLSNILGEGIVDLLYEVQFKTPNDKPQDDGQPQSGYLSLLLEHQTNPDKLITFRIQKYMLRLCEEHLRKKPNTALPLIYPLIFYAGKSKYTAPRSFYDLFDNKDLAKQFFTEDVQVISVRDIKDEELQKHCYSGIMMHLMKHIFAKEMYPYIQAIRSSLYAVRDDFQYIEDMLYYITQRAETKRHEDVFTLFQEIVADDKKEDVMTIAEQLRAEGRKEAMSIAEQLRVEGMQKGIEQGIAQGIEKGMLDGEKMKSLEIAHNLLSSGMKIEEISRYTGLTIDEIKTLRS